MTAIPFERSDRGEPDTDRLAPGGVPHDPHAEQCVLGAVMLSPAALEAASSELTGEQDFYRPAHAAVWRALVELSAAGEPVDIVAVIAYLADAGILERVGGPLYLHTLINTVPSAVNAGYYAQRVADLARRRRLREAGVRVVQAAEADDPDAEQLARTELAALADDGDRWPDPLPVPGTRHVPRFPTDALPGWLGAYVVAVAEATQTPPDLAGCLALACLSTAAGGRVHVDVTDTWTEQVNLYTAVALPPGNRKSGVFGLMTGPLWEAEQALIDDARPQRAQAIAEQRIAEATAEKAAAKAASANGDIRDDLTAEAVDLAQKADTITVPPEPQLIVDDATPEAIATLLAEQGGRVAVLSPEGGIFDIIAGRYSAKPNMDVFLKGHVGDPIMVNRRGRKERVPRPALTIGLAVQPAVFREIGKVEAFSGKGLLQRFLFSLPESLVGYRKTRPNPVPPAVRADYRHHLAATVLTFAYLTEPHTLTLETAAEAALFAYAEELEPQLRPTGTLMHIGEWANKLAGTTARIAGLLHVARHFRDGYARPIAADTMNAAITLGRYFTGHTLAVADLMGTETGTDRARAVLDILATHPTRDITRRDLFTALPRRDFPNVAALDPALALLVDLGWIRVLPAPERRGRGRPTVRYRIHPHAQTPPQKTQKAEDHGASP
ncbi:hypothetical protein GCM10023205_52470 [Yinghuangia aomiensis]|uniref:DNA helicase DnaB-like N-terminal domain-containing protein n=1 Tax=Yinghuangia aomiensis TaxID=676205 RepID=A0ABP9HT85_9ACTN